MKLPESAVLIVKDGQVLQIAKRYRSNGIALSPGEKILYVNGEKVIHAYDVRPDGIVENSVY